MLPNSKTIKTRRMKFLLSSCLVCDSTSFPSISCSTRKSFFNLNIDECITPLTPLYGLLRIEQDASIQHLPVVEKLLIETYRFLACPGHSVAIPSFITESRIGKADSLSPLACDYCCMRLNWNMLGFQKWDSAAKGPNINLSNDGATAQTTSGGWETVRALVCHKTRERAREREREIEREESEREIKRWRL